MVSPQNPAFSNSNKMPALLPWRWVRINMSITRYWFVEAPMALKTGLVILIIDVAGSRMLLIGNTNQREFSQDDDWQPI